MKDEPTANVFQFRTFSLTLLRHGSKMSGTIFIIEFTLFQKNSFPFPLKNRN